MALSTRKFYKTTYKVVLLSEDPMPDNLSLSDVEYAMTEGHCSGEFDLDSEEPLDGLAMAKALIAQRSDPEFLGLTKDGEDLTDDLDENNE